MPNGIYAGGGAGLNTSYRLISISGGTATIQAGSKAVLNSYMVAAAAFTLAIANPKEGGTYVLDITKTVAGDVLITLPVTSSPTTINLVGAVDSLFQLVITYDKFDDGIGGTIYRYVVTSFAL